MPPHCLLIAAISPIPNNILHLGVFFIRYLYAFCMKPVFAWFIFYSSYESHSSFRVLPRFGRIWRYFYWAPTFAVMPQTNSSTNLIVLQPIIAPIARPSYFTYQIPLHLKGTFFTASFNNIFMAHPGIIRIILGRNNIHTQENKFCSPAQRCHMPQRVPWFQAADWHS